MADFQFHMPDLEEVISAEVRRITEAADQRIENGVVDDIVTALRAKGWTCISPGEVVETPREVREKDAEYLATVISQGRMIGAPWLTIASRIVQTDLPGLGYQRRVEK